MGFRPWVIDNGPVNPSDSKDIELGKQASMNERVANFAAVFQMQVQNNTGGALPSGSVTDVISLLDRMISWKLTIGGKTLWTLSASELIQLAIYKTRSIPTLGGLLDITGGYSGILTGLAAGATSTVIGEISIFFHFNQPQSAFPSLLAPGIAQLKGGILTWARGAAAGNSWGGVANSLTIVNVQNIRLVQSLAFERGYFVAPMAFIDKTNLSNKVSPISGGFCPNVYIANPNAAVGQLVTYAAAYGEELHGMNPNELQNLYSENGKTTFEINSNYPFFTPVKYLPLNGGIEDCLPSPLGESLEVTTPQAAEYMYVERYVPTNEFIPTVNSKLGDIAVGKAWEVAGIPGQVYSQIPNEYMEYMPKKLVTPSK